MEFEMVLHWFMAIAGLIFGKKGVLHYKMMVSLMINYGQQVSASGANCLT